MYIEFPILSTYPQNVDGLLTTIFIYPHSTTKPRLWEEIFSWNTYTSGILKWNKCLKIRLDRLTIAYYN